MEIKIPEVGESIIEALVAKWHKKDGERVAKEDPLCEIETDKITMELNAEVDGLLSIQVPEGTTVRIGAVIGLIVEQKAAEGIPASSESLPSPAVTPHISPTARKAAREKQVKVKVEEKIEEQQETLFP